MNLFMHENIHIERVCVLLTVVFVILSILSLSFSTVEASPTVTTAAFELFVVPNPPGADADIEYLKLSNLGSSAVDMTGWKLLDNNGTELSLFGILEGSGDILACANVNYTENGGKNCNYEFPTGFNLVNTDGSVQLVAPSGTVIVEVIWSSATTETYDAFRAEGAIDILYDVNICHGAQASTVVYGQISADVSSILGTGHDSHLYDIIPSFFYDDESGIQAYLGSNWTSQNKIIWENECIVPVHNAVTVVKVVDDESGKSTDFNFTFNFNDDEEEEDFSLTGDGQFTFEDLEDTYQLVHEYDVVGWNLDDIVCESAYSDGRYVSDITYDFIDGDADVEVDLDRGDHVICTFFNSKDQSPTGTIAVKKIVNDDVFVDIAAPFNFYSSWGGSLSLNDGDMYTSNPLSILEGPFSITEYTAVGWENPEVSCVSDLVPERLISNQAISLEEGETVTCTFYNTRTEALYPIRGYTWDDTDGNGQWDDSESGIPEKIIALRPMNLRPVEELYIPADGTVVTTSQALDAQRTYVIEVQGVYQYKESTSYRYADSEWAYRNDIYVDSPLLPHQWTAGELTYPNPSDLDIKINQRNIDWGSFNGAHIYNAILQGNGLVADFTISDNSSDDNHGGLDVALYDVTPYVTTTDENGLYSFSVPSGEYKIINKSENAFEQTFPQSPSYYRITVRDESDFLYNFGAKPTDTVSMGNLTVIKRVLGGPLAASDFTFDVWKDYVNYFTGDNESQGSWVMSNEIFNENGENTVMLPYGQYDVRELSGSTDYNITYDGCTNMQIPTQGEGEAVCVITNTYIFEEPNIEYGPYCGDGVLNQDWEQCEIGDSGCATDICQWEEQNQCGTTLPLIKVTLGASDSVSFDDTLYLGSATNPIPSDVWFNFNELGDDMINDIATQDNGLAISRDTAGGRLLLGLRGENNRREFDVAAGKIETRGVNLGSVNRHPVVSWPLESGSDGAYRDMFSVDTFNDLISFDLHAGKGRDAVAVDINDGEPYNYPSVTLPPESAICEFGSKQTSHPELTLTTDEEEHPYGRRFPRKPVGQVLGVSTTTTATPTEVCTAYVDDYMQKNMENSPVEVYKLQAFFIGQGMDVSMTGVFDDATDAAVRAFQLKYQSDILTPWYTAGITSSDNPTGYVYLTTKWKINDIMCPEIAPFPNLFNE